MADHDRHPFSNFVKLYCRGAACLSIGHDSAILDRWNHFDLASVEVDKGLLIRRDVKVRRKNSVAGCRGKPYVNLLRNFRTMLPQSQHEFIERLVRRAGNFDPGVTLVGATFTNFDFLDFKIS